MTDKTDQNSESIAQGQQVERAFVAPDGTITISGCEADLTSVDVADVDLLLGFADGTFVIIPNGALDALSDVLHKVVFVDKDDTAFDEAHFSSDHQTSLSDLFKMVGTTDSAKSGSLRVVSEHIDADQPGNEVVTVNDDVADDIIVVKVSDGGTGGDSLIPNPQLIPTVDAEEVAPEILQRPSVFTPGKVTANVDPAIWLDANVTIDDTVNIAESNSANLVTITGKVGGSAIIGDTVTVTVGSHTVPTLVLDDMTFSVDIPGNHFVDSSFPDVVEATITTSDGKSASNYDNYFVDLDAPQPTITLDANVAADGVINVDESQGMVTITGTVSESTGAPDNSIAGEQITLTVNGTDVYGFVNPDGVTFNIDVPGNLLAPNQGIEGGSGIINAKIDAFDSHGNYASAVDSATFAIDTLKPTASIQLDTNIAGDGTIDFAESLGDVTITGLVGLDVQDNDTVTLVVNNRTYTGSVSGGSFSINVAGSDLVDDADSIIDASVITFDAADNSSLTATASESYIVDTTLPVPEIYLDAITGDDIINQIEAGASIIAITGWVAGDAQVGDLVSITVNGNLVAEGYVSSDMTFSVNVVGSDLAAVGDGGTGSVDATITTAGSGGAGTLTVSGSYLVDLTPAIPTITVNDITPIDGTTANTVNIAEAAADVVVTGLTTSAQAGDNVTLTINNIDYSGLVRPDGSYSINVRGSDLIADSNSSISASIVTYDTAGNSGTGIIEKFYGVDIDRPTATIVIDDAALNIGDSALVTITFDAPVTDFSNADLTIGNGTLTDVVSTDGGKTWTATLTPDSPVESTANIIILDNAGVIDLNGNIGDGTTDSGNYTVDTISPMVTGVQVGDILLTDADVGGSFSVEVTFSEGMNTTISPSITFGSGASGSLTLTGGGWDGTGSIYTANYDVVDAGFDASGVTVDVSGAFDANGNAQIDYAEQAEFSIDTLNPTVIIAEDNADGVVSPTDNVVNYTLTFSEEVVSFTDLDLTITGGDLTSGPVLSSDGLSATFSVTAFDKSTEPLSVTVDGTVVDLNGNLLVPETLTLPVDTLNPRVTITEDNTDGVVSDSDNVVNYTLTFSAEVVSVLTSDLTVSGGAVTIAPILAADGLSAAFSVTAFDNSEVDLAVTVNDTIVDLVGRSLVPATNTLTVDTVNPTVIIAEDNVDGIVSPTDQVVDYTLTFSEEVTSLSASDLTIIGGDLTGGPVLAADSLSATFSVTAFDNSASDLVVTVNDSVLDLNGNPLLPTNNILTVDTINPRVIDVASDTLLTDSDHSFFVVVKFSESMDTAVDPTLVFGVDVSDLFVLNSMGWYNNDTKYVAVYSVSDSNIDMDSITIDVIGAQDVGGNVQQDYTALVEFDIDTLNPTVSIIDNNADGVVDDFDDVVNYTLTFSEEVIAVDASDLSISGGTLTGGPVLAGDGLSATFTVTAFDDSTADLVVTINNTVVDVNGNPLIPASNTLTVDTALSIPDFECSLYTSSEFKVTGGSGDPAGSYVDGATPAEHLLASSPAGQSTRERIDGIAGNNDTISHNLFFSDDSSKWAKTLHIDFSVFDVITTIELVAGLNITDIPGFSLGGSGLTWTLSPYLAMSADLMANGLDLDIVYTVTDTGGPVDFDVVVNVSGTEAGVAHDLTKTLDFTWRDAITEADFDVIKAGNQVMVLPREGLGVDINAGDGDDIVNAGAGHDIVYGGAGVDTINGGTGDDVLNGGTGIDTIDGGEGHDILNGDADGDTLIGGAGNDVLNGGTGFDTIDGGEGNDILNGDADGDTLYGDSGNDVLDGGTGVDNLNGGAGNDLLIGGVDGDVLDGGDDIDTVSYAGSVVDITASLSTGLGTGGDKYFNVENLIGSDGADRLIGDGNDNVLTGGDGDDILIGGAALTGDTLEGGLGNDTASYFGSVADITASLSTNSGSAGDATGDTYSGIENLTGGDGADTLIGDGNDNVLIGGGGGDDMQGGGGSDTASYAGASQGVIAALESSLFDFQTNDALGDTFAQIENLIGSSQGDSLYGNSSDNLLDGGLGNDNLYGFAGNDNLYADQGNDTARGDIGDDTIHVSSDGANLPDNIDGGAGIDTMVLYDLGGTYDFTDLAGLDSRLENLEILDIRESADSRVDVDTNISITGLDVQNMVDDGAASVLVVRADIGDSLDLSALGVLDTDYTVTDISGGTEYSIITGDLATIQWITG